ncbi:MAG: phosphoribosylanthranilate isomerase [Verrucomicrobiota bacterium]
MSFLDSGGVKICGITSPADALMCISAGADAVGFNFFSGSPRAIDPAGSFPWIRDLGSAADRVAVVVNPTAQVLDQILAAGCFEAIQFHGDETPEFCARSGGDRWLKAIRVSGPDSIAAALAFPTPNVLFDGWTAEAYGGTGQRMDWDIARDFVIAHPDRRLILAGGLNVQNVRQAVRIVRPHAVDVASGVELNTRKKDEYLVRQFIREAKSQLA